MKRLNPETSKPFKMGYVREDDKIFSHYLNEINKKGFYYEVWQTKAKFFKRQTEKKIYNREYKKTWLGRANHMFSNCRGSAKRRHIDFKITIDDVFPGVANGVCQLTGLPFDFNPHKEKENNPYAPSVDRIDNNKGYVPGNIRIVLWAVNSALGESSDEEMLPILKAMVRAIQKNAKQKSTSSISDGHSGESEIYPELGAISCPGFGEDSNNPDDYSGATQGENAYHSAKEGSGDSLGRGMQEVVALSPLTRIEDHGQPDAEIVRLEFGRRYLSDKP
jgi:hypothetical protein